MATDYGKLNRTSPHRVIGTTYNNLACGPTEEWITVQYSGRDYLTDEPHYQVWMQDAGEVFEVRYEVYAHEIESVIRDQAQYLSTTPQAGRLDRAIANTKTYYRI